MASRQRIADTAESWTCKGSVTECLCALILFFSDDRISVESNWNDFMLLLGIDHRCVYCRLRFALAGRANNYNNMS